MLRLRYKLQLCRSLMPARDYRGPHRSDAGIKPRGKRLDKNAVVQLAEMLARQVGAEMKKRLADPATLQVSSKGRRTDLVTEVDLWSEQLITSVVSERFPDHGVVGEEKWEQLATSRGCGLPELLSDGIIWLVDPIDGTSNFSNGVPYCCVSIAVLKDGRREAGVVYDPSSDEMFVAKRGEGATLNGNRIRVGSRAEAADALIASAFPNDRAEWWHLYWPPIQELILNCRNVRSFGAAALDLCWVACGRFDGFFEFGLKPWDIAAASLIVEEAGGTMESFQSGASADGFALFGSSFLASGKSLFSELKGIVSKHPLIKEMNA